MKKLILLLLIACIWSCSGPQKPNFLRLENVKVTKISTRNITITADALFHNPNALGGTLISTDIDVISHDIAIAKVVQQTQTTLPAQAEFSVPFSFNTKPKKLFEQDGNSILGGVINALLDKSVTLVFRGSMTFKIAGISFKTPVDFEEKIQLRE